MIDSDFEPSCAAALQQREDERRELQGERDAVRAMLKRPTDRVTALLALPADASIDDITKAVEICVRRCEALELDVLHSAARDPKL